MRILKIIHGYPPEYNAGSEVYSQSICNELCHMNEVFIFSREENEYAKDFEIREVHTGSAIRHFLVNMARGKDGYNHELLNKRFRELVIELKPDVAHIGHLNHLSIGLVDELRYLKIPILFTLHDFWLMCPRGQFLQRNFDGNEHFKLCDKQESSKCADSCYGMYYSGIDTELDRTVWTKWIDTRMRAIRNIVSKVNLFHAPSKYLMNRFINDFNIDRNKIFYLDYGFPTPYLHHVESREKNEFTFAYIGTHTPPKGINLLIEAFAGIDYPVRLKIFGRANGQNTSALKKLAAKSKNRVEFCGEYVNQNLSTMVFNQVDCIVVPSIWVENSPLVIHEAQACKIPVITADYGGMSEYVQHMVNGLLFRHRQVNSLREYMEFAVKNPERMKAFGKRGYIYSENGEVPSINGHCRELMKYYQKLVDYGK
jgi:glycosyltransferase involved in cell wall biosynthesis